MLESMVTIPLTEYNELLRLKDKKSPVWVSKADFLKEFPLGPAKTAFHNKFRLPQYRHLKRTGQGCGIEINIKEYRRIYGIK